MNEVNNPVIEINEVEYLVTSHTKKQIEDGVEMVLVHRLVDNKDMFFPLHEVKKALKNNIVDYL